MIHPQPTSICELCGRTRDPFLHMRADSPPEAAKKWLERTCPRRMPGHKHIRCPIKYRAGFVLPNVSESDPPKHDEGK